MPTSIRCAENLADTLTQRSLGARTQMIRAYSTSEIAFRTTLVFAGKESHTRCPGNSGRTQIAVTQSRVFWVRTYIYII